METYTEKSYVVSVILLDLWLFILTPQKGFMRNYKFSDITTMILQYHSVINVLVFISWFCNCVSFSWKNNSSSSIFQLYYHAGSLLTYLSMDYKAKVPPTFGIKVRIHLFFFFASWKSTFLSRKSYSNLSIREQLISISTLMIPKLEVFGWINVF